MLKNRKNWTAQEDAVLQQQVGLAGGNPRDWTTIATSLPGRTNKDCRKRWHNNLVCGFNKGPWEVEEDEKLEAAVRQHGLQWPMATKIVKTRSADQCAKRWNQALDPSLDRSRWSPQEQATLLQAVAEHGKAWKLIQEQYFPGRATNNIKNSYMTLTKREHAEQVDDAETTDSASKQFGLAGINAESSKSTAISDDRDNDNNNNNDEPSYSMTATNSDAHSNLDPLLFTTGTGTEMDTFFDYSNFDIQSDFQDDVFFSNFPSHPPDTTTHAGHHKPHVRHSGSASGGTLSSLPSSQRLTPSPSPPSNHVDPFDALQSRTQRQAADGGFVISSALSSSAMETCFSRDTDLSSGSSNFVLQIENPSADTVKDVIGALVNSNATFRSEMRRGSRKD